LISVGLYFYPKIEDDLDHQKHTKINLMNIQYFRTSNL